MLKIGYIADDLTGSNATAVMLRKIGLEVATVISDSKIPANPTLHVVGMDLDCRYMPDNIVENRMQRATEELKKWGAQLFANRIDSTLRGKIGLTTDFLIETLGKNSIAVLCPAFPESGRTMIGGYLMVHGNLLENTSVKDDPMNPIYESYVPKMIQEQSRNKVGHIGLDIVNRGTQSLVNHLTESITRGHQILVTDAVNNNDIQTIAIAMKQLPFTVFPVDPGPLTYEYMRLYFPHHSNSKKFIFAIGSVTDLTKKQISYLVNEEHTTYIYLDPTKLLTPLTREREIEKAIKKAKELNGQNVIIISTCHPNIEKISLTQIAKEQNIPENELAKSLTKSIAKVTTNIIEFYREQVGGVISSGGDVTASLCELTDAKAIRLLNEVDSLIAYGELMEGTLKQLPIITKGGLVGDEKTLVKCLKYLQTIT